MSVEEQIARGNDWYVGDQAATQLGTPGARRAIENRWRLFRSAIVAWLASRGAGRRALRVLDAGCGDGNNIAALQRILTELDCQATIIGTDYNEFRLARAHARSGAMTLKADLLRLPFADRTFDLVLCNHVIEHIPADVDALRELKRTLAADGMLMVGVPNEGCTLARLRNRVLQRSILRTTDHVNFYTSESLLARVRAAELEPLGAPLREGFFLPHLGVMLRLRETKVGSWLLDTLAAVLPSQSAGLLVLARPVGGPGA